jgi:hypothetical protein
MTTADNARSLSTENVTGIGAEIPAGHHLPRTTLSLAEAARHLEGVPEYEEEYC